MTSKQDEHLSGTGPRARVTPRKLSSWIAHSSAHREQLVTIAIAGLVFLAVILKINHKLLTVPINEYYDYAANTLQIEDAKHFHTLLGNYSQWGFHHPGPIFFYWFALGELILHDWLYIAPAVMNAHLVTMIVLNSIFLFTTIAIFAQHSKSRLFIPIAVISSVYFIYVINHSLAGSALTSIWMPYVLLFPFLLFVTVCASVASGNARQLTIMTFAGLMLLHGHVAQPVFVGPLAIIALAALWSSTGRQLGLGTFLRNNRRTLCISAALDLPPEK